MTHTAEPMTLARVSEDVKDVYYSAPDQLTEAIVPLRKLLVWKQVIDAELAKQREAEPSATVTGLLGMSNVTLDKWLPVGTKLYTHPQQRNAVEVSDNELPGMWSSTDFTGGDPNERCYAQRARDREDAERYQHLAKIAHWEDERDMGPGGRYWISIMVDKGKPTFEKAVDAARRENKP
jgi:hypothetical protein